MGNAKMVLGYSDVAVFYFQYAIQQKKRERPFSHSRFPFSYKIASSVGHLFYGFGTISP